MTKPSLIQTSLLCAFVLQTLVSGAQPVTTIAAGGLHSLFLKRDGSLWGMGDNTSGGLGLGTNVLATIPQQILSSNVTIIAAGWLDSFFVKSDGSLWAMGYDIFGELGDGTYRSSNKPELIMSNSVVAVSAGFWHSLFLKSDGSLWGMGNNGVGQLGGLLYDRNYAVKSPGQIVASNVMLIAAGYDYSLFLKNNNSLWAMGWNQNGQLGDGTYTNTSKPEQIVASNVVAIAAGNGYQGGHTLFLKNDGSLWGMGYNADGELGDGTYNNTNKPELIVTSNVTAIATGYFHSLFLKSDGSLWGMGWNQFGQLGDGTLNQINNRPEQILAAYNQLSGQLLGTGDIRLSFAGVANMSYALDRSFSLSPPNWMPQATNPANSFGALILTNTPDLTTNNFWRIRSVP
ncbi:MAG TPA: chromosome condensation regulator [Verrucomicrobiae bacterium]|nr:chromosome condensation regulator [Verrucomicrobiae bacterium]